MSPCPFFSLFFTFFPLQVTLLFHPELKCRKKPIYFGSSFTAWGFSGLFSLFYFTLFFSEIVQP